MAATIAIPYRAPIGRAENAQDGHGSACPFFYSPEVPMHLSNDRAQQFHDRLPPTLGYLAKLKKRLRELRIDEKDPLFARETEAHGAMQGSWSCCTIIRAVVG